jgi:outer membrane protein OmpA-like peptidoglycan-associated protein
MSLFKCRIVAFTFLLSVFAGASVDEQLPMNQSGQAGLYRLYSAQTLGFAHLALNLHFDFAYDKNFVKSLLDTSRYSGQPIDSIPRTYPEAAIGNVAPSVTFGILDFLDFSAMLPVYFDVLNYYSLQGGIGDMDLSLKFRIPRKKENRIIDAGLLSSMILPTGTKNSGYFPRYTYYYNKKSLQLGPSYLSGSDSLFSFYSSRSCDFLLDGLFTLDLKYFLFHLNTGARFTLNPDLDNTMLVSTGIELHPSKYFAFTTELGSETRWYNLAQGFKIFNDPVWIAPAFTFTSDGGATITLSSMFSLSSDKYNIYKDPKNGMIFSTAIQPKWRMSLQVGWNGSLVTPDKDRDGILNDDDKCPTEPEDIDGFEDSDGCPDLDNDKDGIPDIKDKCPNAKEDFDGYMDDDGCPDYDNDDDKIADSIDVCPNAKEDFDGYQDQDGCPDPDNDQDGVVDSLDKCPNQPEDIDGFEDTDGCPDIDNDMDGVPDSLDKCPNETGSAENQGCPNEKTEVKEIKPGRVVLRGVEFESGSAIMTQSSYNVLDRVYESLVQWPQVMIEIRGHVSSLSNSNDNMVLSQKRAAAVRDYLLGRGISSSRLTILGKGDAEPLLNEQALRDRIEIIRQN